MMKSKSIGYAYPSSITANELVHGKTGCWFVAIHDSDSPRRKEYILASEDFKTAYEYWRLMPEPVSRWCQTRSSTWPIVLRRETRRIGAMPC